MINILEIEIFSPGQNDQKSVVKKKQLIFHLQSQSIKKKYNFSFICANNSNLLDRVKCQGQQNFTEKLDCGVSLCIQVSLYQPHMHTLTHILQY